MGSEAPEWRTAFETTSLTARSSLVHCSSLMAVAAYSRARWRALGTDAGSGGNRCVPSTSVLTPASNSCPPYRRAARGPESTRHLVDLGLGAERVDVQRVDAGHARQPVGKLAGELDALAAP